MNIRWLEGLSDYAATLDLQQQLVDSRINRPDAPDELLLLEHSPVYTIGRIRDHSSLHAPGLLPHPVFETNRGGQATYHGPGQLVAYPIIDLNRMGRDIHLYISLLETALIAACAEHGVQATRREGLTGVWAGPRKLASIGVGIKKWIAMHGIAINIAPRRRPPGPAGTPPPAARAVLPPEPTASLCGLPLAPTPTRSVSEPPAATGSPVPDSSPEPTAAPSSTPEPTATPEPVRPTGEEVLEA